MLPAHPRWIRSSRSPQAPVLDEGVGERLKSRPCSARRTSIFYDVGGVCPDGHISYDEFPGYKAADKTKYREYFDGKVFPPEPENFGKFPPEALFPRQAYIAAIRVYPVVFGEQGPEQTTLDLIKLLGGKCEKLGDELARKLGSPYGLNSLEYAADKGHYDMYFVFMPWSEAGGHLMLITLNPQFDTVAAGAAELSIFLKTQADVIRTLSGCDVLPMDRAHPLWRFLGGSRHALRFLQSAQDARGGRKRRAVRDDARSHRSRKRTQVRFFGSEKTEEQKEQDRETCRRNGSKTDLNAVSSGGRRRLRSRRAGPRDVSSQRSRIRSQVLFGSEKTEEQKEQDRETCRRIGRENGPKYGLFGSEKTEEQKEQDRELCRRNRSRIRIQGRRSFLRSQLPNDHVPVLRSERRASYLECRADARGKSVR